MQPLVWMASCRVDGAQQLFGFGGWWPAPAAVSHPPPRRSCVHPPTPPPSSPQFVFLDASGKPVAAAVGKLPKEVLVGNTRALAAGEPLPYARIQASGASTLQRPDGAMAGPRQSGPLDHS